jgi:hypothetical protein
VGYEGLAGSWCVGVVTPLAACMHEAVTGGQKQQVVGWLGFIPGHPGTCKQVATGQQRALLRRPHLGTA